MPRKNFNDQMQGSYLGPKFDDEHIKKLEYLSKVP